MGNITKWGYPLVVIKHAVLFGTKVGTGPSLCPYLTPMSALGGKADITYHSEKSPLLAISGHQNEKKQTQPLPCRHLIRQEGDDFWKDRNQDDSGQQQKEKRHRCLGDAQNVVVSHSLDHK